MMAAGGFSERELSEAYDRMSECLKKMDFSLRQSPWLAGEHYSLADIAMISFIDRINNSRHDLFDTNRLPRLIDWYEKAERGRYHLYVAHGCPWAHRTLIYRVLKKLDGLISVAYSVPGLKKTGWTFEDDPRFPDCTPDTVNGFHYLYEAYVATDKNYTGKVTVPTLWDKKTKRIVNNESPK